VPTRCSAGDVFRSDVFRRNHGGGSGRVGRAAGGRSLALLGQVRQAAGCSSARPRPAEPPVTHGADAELLYVPMGRWERREQLKGAHGADAELFLCVPMGRWKRREQLRGASFVVSFSLG
jgi:hypothetical protein